MVARHSNVARIRDGYAAFSKGDFAASPLGIAVVGMAGMFAGSTDTNGFWNTILSGKDEITEVPTERWDPAIYYTPELSEGTTGRRTVSKWGGFLRPVTIDPIRFGIPPSALSSIDPSQLLALEVANQALNDAGYPYDAPGADHSRTGVVFAAEPGSDYRDGLTLRAVLPAYLGDLPPELDEQLPSFTEDTFPGQLANVIAGRIANRLDLGGANFTVDAASAASLAALDVACSQLTAGSTDLMLCGAVDLHNSIGDFLMFGSVQALSAKGRVAAFDAAADGTALGEGVACVALKRLADARRDGDRVYAVIKGVGAASDRRARSLTAPRVEGQVQAMRRAYRQAGVSPSEVELIEAHGTGTVVGDQTELESLTEVFTEAGAKPGGCVLGSVKSQIGHAKAAAGMAGLIKAVLAVHYGVQPPTSNLARPNVAWDPERSPFAFLKEARPWVTPVSRRFAGLSAFGFGGINFHVVLSGHPGTPQPRHACNEWPAELFCFRGADRGAALEAVHSLIRTLEAAGARPGRATLRDLAARTAQAAESADGQIRIALVARDIGELAVLLRRALNGEHDTAAGLIQPPAAEPTEPPAVAFLFPGQGSQHPGALAELFVAFPQMRQYLEIGPRWAGLLFPPAAFDPAREGQHSDLLCDTRAAQPALGICGLAVSHLLGCLGIRPDMSGGHSYGELVALATAGAFDPVTLIELSDARATAILSAAGEDPGTMAAANGTADQITAALAGHGLTGEVTLANHNAPDQVVISGPTPAVASALAALREADLTARQLPVACAFHSPVVAAACERFADALASRQISVPRLPVWSNRTAAPYPADPEFIRAEMAAQISAPVRFADEVEAMYAAGARVFAEVGPGQVLSGLVRAVLGDRPHLTVACDGPPGQGLRKFLTALAQMACAGVPLDISWLFQGRTTADPGVPAENGRPLWTVHGQLIRDGDGTYLPGALVPPRRINRIKEFPVSPSTTPAGRDSVLAEYLRASRDMVSAQRDVMLAFLGGQPVSRLVSEQEPSAEPLAGLTASQSAAPAAAEPVVADPRPADEHAGPERTPGPDLQDALIALISERTGYPADLIEPDLDLEADLSIDSIKRTDIARVMASKAGISAETTRSAIGELVKARTVRGIIDLLEQLAADTQTDGEAAAPAPDAQADGQAAASDPAASKAEPAGTAPLRLLPRLARLDIAGQPPRPVSGARFVITGETPVADHLAGRLRELGAQVNLSAMDTAARDDVREADGLIFLDGLAESATALPPAMFPLVKDALTSGNATATGQRWLLAAGDRSRSATAGLAGLFRTIGAEYPDCLARYVEFDRVAPADEIAARLLRELLAGAQAPTVIYAGNTRYRRELVLAELSIDADDGAASGGPGSAETRAIGLTSDSVIVLIGGARGITSRIARELAAASHCRIELIGRTQTPDESLLDDTEGAPGAVPLRAALARRGMRSPSEIERATRDILAFREVEATLTELHELGAAARYHCADAQDTEAIHQILKTVHEEYGRVDGLVYGAGVIEDHLIASKDPESFARVFHTKVSGARVVLDTLEELHCAPGFAVLFGSTAAVCGSRGQADYAAANDALEALGTAWAARAGCRCLTVHWGPWAPAGVHPGMVTPELTREYARRGIGTIDPGKGALSLLRELAWGDPGLRSVIYTGQAPDAG